MTRQSHRVDRPVAGYYRMKRIRGGPWIGVRIWRCCHCTPVGPAPHAWRPECDRYPPLIATVEGKDQPPLPLWSWVAGREISEADYRYLTEGSAWDRLYDPQAPSANPDKPIDLGSMPPLY